MNVSPISPNFQGELTSKIGRSIKQTITDPTDVHNKDAVVSGTVATGGVGGAAVVASRLKTMKNMATAGRVGINRAIATGRSVAALKAKNAGILTKFLGRVSDFCQSSKATSWLSRLMTSPAGKKITGTVVGLSALGITAAQLYSAGDMALEAATGRKKYDYNY